MFVHEPGVYTDGYIKGFQTVAAAIWSNKDAKFVLFSFSEVTGCVTGGKAAS